MGRGRDVSNEPISQIEAHQLFDTVVEALKGVVEQVNEALLAQHKGLVDMADQMNKAFESRDELYAGKGLCMPSYRPRRRSWPRRAPSPPSSARTRP